MNKHIHVRDFDGKAHKLLTRKAKEKGLSLSGYLRFELAVLARREGDATANPKESPWDALRKLPDIKTSLSGAELVREDRDSR